MTTINKNFFIAPSTTGLGAMRWVATLLLAVMMLTTAQTAWAQTTITPTTPSQDGDGYFLIGTAAELYGFAELVNSGNASANAKLTADIVVNENVLDANGEANTGDFVQWTPKEMIILRARFIPAHSMGRDTSSVDSMSVATAGLLDLSVK